MPTLTLRIVMTRDGLRGERPADGDAAIGMENVLREGAVTVVTRTAAP